MRGVLAALTLTAAVVAATPALAVDDAKIEARYTPAYQKCLDTTEGQSTMGMIDCIGAETTRQDAKLNDIYKKDMAGLNARQQTTLKAAQRAWVAFRDADCAAQQDEDWGSLSRVAANSCVLSRTVERTIELENYPPPT